MGVRDCAEIGENLQKIITRLMANDNLVNLLYYTEKDPLDQPHLTSEQKKTEVFEKLIKILLMRHYDGLLSSGRIKGRIG